MQRNLNSRESEEHWRFVERNVHTFLRMARLEEGSVFRDREAAYAAGTPIRRQSAES